MPEPGRYWVLEDSRRIHYPAYEIIFWTYDSQTRKGSPFSYSGSAHQGAEGLNHGESNWYYWEDIEGWTNG